MRSEPSETREMNSGSLLALGSVRKHKVFVPLLLGPLHRSSRTHGPGPARHPDQGHDHALRAVRRGRARPDLRAHPPQGLAQARPWGRKLGRPKGSLGVSRLNGKEDEIRRFLQMGVPKTAIAKITGVSRTTLRSGPSRPVPPFLGELRWRRLRWPPHPDLQIMYRCKDLRRLSFSS